MVVQHKQEYEVSSRHDYFLTCLVTAQVPNNRIPSPRYHCGLPNSPILLLGRFGNWLIVCH